MGICLFLFLLMIPNPVNGKTTPDTIFPHEEAYRSAPYIVLGHILSFDNTSGALVEIDEAIRGDIAPGTTLILRGTNHFPFLDAPGMSLTIFLKGVHEKEAVLWQGPTTGGIIWKDDYTLGLIAAASANPQASLGAPHPRERLAAAYYLATQAGGSDETMDHAVRSLIWGLAQKEHETNQAALNAFKALEIDIQAIAGPYHPGFKPELKQASAEKVKEWWEQRE